MNAKPKSLVFRGATFTGGKRVKTGVRVEDGLIVAIGGGDLGPAERVIELTDEQVLAPAGVEALAAMRDWAEAPRDTVEAVTKAALAAGVTFVCDQANTVPRLNKPELVRKRSQTLAEKSYVDFGIGAHPPAEPHRLAEYREAGALCLQLFPWDMRAWNQPPDMDDSPATFRAYAESGLSALIFVDDVAIRDLMSDVSETYALQGVLRRLDPAHNVRLFVTLPSSVDAIVAARQRLPKVLIQSASWQVLISRQTAFERIGSAAFSVPPFRDAADVDRMRTFAEQGVVDVMVSHHTPHRTADKYSGDPIPGEYTPKAGFSTIDYTYALLLTKFGFEVACRAYCEVPAKHLGLNKGMIAKGYEADLVIFDEDPGRAERNIHVTGGLAEHVWKVEPNLFHSLGRVTPFVGERLKYKAAKTFLRGEEAYDAATGTFRRLAVRQARA
jgi:dihydroorotase-like cyclic amidohydrolase